MQLKEICSIFLKKSDDSDFTKIWADLMKGQPNTGAMGGQINFGAAGGHANHGAMGGKVHVEKNRTVISNPPTVNKTSIAVKEEVIASGTQQVANTASGKEWLQTVFAVSSSSSTALTVNQFQQNKISTPGFGQTTASTIAAPTDSEQVIFMCM